MTALSSTDHGGPYSAADDLLEVAVTRELCARQLRRSLPAYAQRHIGAALAGDADEAESLIVAAPNELRPLVLLALSSALGPRHPAVLSVLISVWNHDHRHFLNDLGRRSAWSVLKASGTRPIGLPGKVVVWRGGLGSPDLIKRGWSWTTDRRVACFFVDHWKSRGGRGAPCVVKAEIETKRIVHTDNERHEAEMVIFGSRTATVDGTPGEWSRLSAELSDERKMESAHATAVMS